MKFVKSLLVLLMLFAFVPAFAQEGEPDNTLTFNGFSFSFDSTLATNVSITQYLTEPADVFPPQGKHTHFALYSEQSPTDSIVGIRVYRIEDLASQEHLQQQVTQLQTLLDERHDLSQFSTLRGNIEGALPLPFLPSIAAGQTIRSRVHYIGTPELSGISYVTAYQQTMEPLLQDNFLYTFQGISADALYYVSAVFRVKPASFPSEIPADFNYETFQAEFTDYLDESTTQLNDATPESFTPSVADLSLLIQSITWK